MGKTLKEIIKDYDKAKKWYRKGGALGNEVLYDLCLNKKSKLYGHKDVRRIQAKIWLIGRAYSAALERGNLGNKSKEVLYKEVGEKLVKYFNRINNLDPSTIWDALASKIFNNSWNKYSLASKYLHFHFPKKYFIYDSISNKQLKKLCRRLHIQIEGDNFCQKYFNLCDKLLRKLENAFRLKLNNPTPYKTRNLDILLQYKGSEEAKKGHSASG